MPTQTTAARSDMPNEQAPGIGHNNPPTPVSVKDRLAADHASIATTVERLAARANEAPAAIEDDEQVKAVGDLVKDIAAVAKNVEALRVAEKEPYLQAGREVDGFFKAFGDRVTRMKGALEGRITTYLRAKADAERRVREEAERRAREEAEARRRESDAAAAAGRREDAAADLREAIAAEDQAAEAAAHAAAKPAEFARTRSDSGTLTTLKATWDFEITDISAIPLERLRQYFSRPDIEKAVRLYVRQGNRELPGVRIFQREQAVVR